MTVVLPDKAPELEPNTSIDAAFSLGMERWSSIRENAALSSDPSTYRYIKNEVTHVLEPGQRRFDVIQSVVDGSRFISESREREELLNDYFRELAIDPDLSLEQLRRMGYGLPSLNGDETVFSVARFLTAGHLLPKV